MLPVSLSCPLPLQRTQPPAVVCCFRVFAEIGVTSTKFGRLEVILSLFEKRHDLSPSLIGVTSDTHMNYARKGSGIKA